MKTNQISKISKCHRILNDCEKDMLIVECIVHETVILTDFFRLRNWNRILGEFSAMFSMDLCVLQEYKVVVLKQECRILNFQW